MKKLLIPFLFISGVIGYMACQKDDSSDPALAKLENTTARIMTNDSGVRRDTILPLTGDQIHITPSKIDSGSHSGLALAAITANYYPCRNNFLVTDSIPSGGDFTINFTGVNIRRTCAGGQAKARTRKVLFPINQGTHVFKVVLNGFTYTGSFVKTGNQYTFTWPYTSGVTISPLTIN